MESTTYIADSLDSGDWHVDVRIVGLDHLYLIEEMNALIFREDRVINTFEREDLLILVAFVDGVPAGFKIGYKEDRFTFYSAKGGVRSEYRRRGVARILLQHMCETARSWGYRRLAYDTIPNRHAGMTVMGLAEGFQVTRADYNPLYRDYRLRFERDL
ncbi:MAG: GNAT family N-acetyltransferase [Rhodothermales bacterium]|nr:GNAT family N-acetyltransferase [Rhodothermales bacterium]